MPRGSTYVDNAMNRSLGRVGMPMGSMVHSGSSGGSSSRASGGGGNSGASPSYSSSSNYSGASSRTYVDNASNRSIGRVGMPVGSMPVSKAQSHSPSSNYSGASSNIGHTYVDNASNRSIGRVGMPVGSMPVSKTPSKAAHGAYSSRGNDSGVSLYSGNSSSGYSSQTSNLSIRQSYTDHTLDHIGYHGSSKLKEQDSVSSAGKTYVDNAYNRRVGRVGKEVGTHVISQKAPAIAPKPKCEEQKAQEGRLYVDNAFNRRVGRVGEVVGTHVISTNGPGHVSNSDNQGSAKDQNARQQMPSQTKQNKRYKDNEFNRRLGRVGKIIGTAVHSRKSPGKGNQNAPRQADQDESQFHYVQGGEPLQRQRVEDGSQSSAVQNSCTSSVAVSFDSNPGDHIMHRRTKQTELIQDVLEHYIQRQGDEFEDDEDSDMQEACDHAFNHLRRQDQTEKWQKETQSKDLPSTANRLFRENIEIIKYEDMELTDKIGQGGFGEVYFAKWKGTIVACKVLRVDSLSKKKLEEFEKEVKILGSLKSASIVKLIGACVGPPKFCIVMEYMQMSLYDALYLDDRPEKKLTDALKHSVLLQAVGGVYYLHQNDIAHCDLKPRNVLLDFCKGRVTAKLSDFGLSTIKKYTETTTTSTAKPVFVACTPRYAAPEILRGELLRKIDERLMTDMYSFAVVCFEVICEDEPFADLDLFQLRKHVGEGLLMPEIPDDVKINESLHVSLNKCWSRKPKERESARALHQVLFNNSKLYSTC